MIKIVFLFEYKKIWQLKWPMFEKDMLLHLLGEACLFVTVANLMIIFFILKQDYYCS